MQRYQPLAALLLRIATAANFLSPVAGRLGFWKNTGTNWSDFVDYTASVNSYAPTACAPALAVIATVLEVAIALLLLVGYKTRMAAIAAALLTLTFATAMTYSNGLKDVMDYAVPVDITSAFLLATMPYYRWSLDEVLNRDTAAR